MAEGQQPGEPDQELQAGGSYEADQNLVHYKIVAFIGAYPDLRS
jgi:hypothetical protein